MKTLLFFLAFSTLALADWSTRETNSLRVSLFPSPVRVPPSLAVLVPSNAEKVQPKGFHIIVQPRPGAVIPEGDEYRVTVRYRGLDGKTYSVTRNLTPDEKGNARALVPCDIDEPLSVMAETVATLHTVETQGYGFSEVVLYGSLSEKSGIRATRENPIGRLYGDNVVLCDFRVDDIGFHWKPCAQEAQ